ncbi:IS91 family transposase, partial [Clostridium estertheticum]|nr:IS91 family transposase [Clostridium estertheticum]
TPILLKEKISTLQLIKNITGRDLSKCPHCGSDNLSRCTLFSRSPPTTIQTA